MGFPYSYSGGSGEVGNGKLAESSAELDQCRHVIVIYPRPTYMAGYSAYIQAVKTFRIVSSHDESVGNS
jgi:hypothetical protein